MNLFQDLPPPSSSSLSTCTSSSWEPATLPALVGLGRRNYSYNLLNLVVLLAPKVLLFQKKNTDPTWAECVPRCMEPSASGLWLPLGGSPWIKALRNFHTNGVTESRNPSDRFKWQRNQVEEILVGAKQQDHGYPVLIESRALQFSTELSHPTLLLQSGFIMSPTGPCVWIHGPQLEALFWEWGLELGSGQRTGWPNGSQPGPGTHPSCFLSGDVTNCLTMPAPPASNLPTIMSSPPWWIYSLQPPGKIHPSFFKLLLPRTLSQRYEKSSTLKQQKKILVFVGIFVCLVGSFLLR